MGCGAEAPPSAVLPVRLHTLAGCDLSGAATSGNLTLLALGDFEASNESAEILPLDREGAALRFPSATRAVEARTALEPRFWGYGEREREALDVLLWPERATCSVFRPDGAQGYPGKRGGQALAYVPATRSLLAAGGNDPLVSDAIVGALTFDAATGAVTTFDTSEPGVLHEPRAFATATSFGAGVLVAGGENPVFGVPNDDIEPRKSAELFDPNEARFVSSIELQNARTRHAAVTLSNGNTLLIGGRTKVGTVSLALGQLELIEPTTNRAKIGQQVAARIAPVALRLSDGRVFIGGGTTHDGGVVTPAGEWLTAEGEPDGVLDDAEMPAGFSRAFTALPGGGVLAVGGCAPREPANVEERASCEAECERGCPPLAASDSSFPYAYQAWWIEADGSAQPVPLGNIAAPRPILLPGSDGRPWLVAATQGDPKTPRLFRFNPWEPGFSAVLTAEGVRLPRPDFPQPVAIDLDTFVWLDESELFGVRLGTRNRFTQHLALVLQSDPLEPSRPLHLVPDRPLELPERYDGRLWLDGSAPKTARVFVADTDYADVSVRLHLEDSDGVVSEPPVILLGDAPLGGEACRWPDGDARGGDADVPTLLRKEQRAELRFHGGRKTCPAPKGRVSLALQAGTGASIIRRIDVQRGAVPAASEGR